MKWVYKTFRALIIITIALAIILPVTAYIVVSLPSVQNALRERAEIELSKLLDSDVRIGRLSIAPFNQISLSDALISNHEGDSILAAKRIVAGIELRQLLLDKKIVVTHAVLRGVDARLWRETPDSALNIQHIIEALQPKDKSKPPTQFDFKVNSVIIRQCAVSYDVKSAPRLSDKFDPNHIKVRRLRADISLPRMANDDFTADIRRLALEEQSGLDIKQLEGYFHISSHELAFKGLGVELPHTQLKIADNSLKINGWKDIKRALLEESHTIEVVEGSHINLSDLQCFVPIFGRFTETYPFNLKASGTPDHLKIAYLNIGGESKSLFLTANGTIENASKPGQLRYDINNLEVMVDGQDAIDLTKGFANIPDKVAQEVIALGNISLKANATGTTNSARGDVDIKVAQGEAVVNGEWNRQGGGHAIKASVSTPGIALGEILHRDDLGRLAGDVDIEAIVSPAHRDITADATLSSMTFKGYTYQNITAHGQLTDNVVDAVLKVDDPNGVIDLAGTGSLDKGDAWVDAAASISSLNLSALNLWNGMPNSVISAQVTAKVNGISPDNADGEVRIDDFALTNNEGKTLKVNNLTVSAQGNSEPKRIEIESDFLDGTLTGSYHFATLGKQIKELTSLVLPMLVSADEPTAPNGEAPTDNNFRFNLKVNTTEALSSIVKLPVTLLSPMQIDGSINYGSRKMELLVDAPYLQQGNKLIENTTLSAVLDGLSGSSQLYATTDFPTKEGIMPLTIESIGEGGRIDTKLNWFIDRERDYKGDISLSTVIGRDKEGKVTADVTINPSQMVFNDSIWQIHQSNIEYREKHVKVDALNVSRNNQFVKIDGEASTSPNDLLTVDLLNVNLDYIFESLGLDNVRLGGDATGVVNARGLFSGSPELTTDNLFVKNISYNSTVFGDADVKSYWNNEEKAVNLYGEITQPNGGKSYVKGDVFIGREALDIRFEADRINVGFLKPYTQAFCSDISGIATGWARIFGTFKDIDLEGKVYGENVKMKIDIINTSYTVTDTVSFSPGLIKLHDITLHDAYGHTAQLDGEIRHTRFRDPTFNFEVNNAKDMLVFDVTEKLNPDWYGHIFGTGSAKIVGVPGHIDISASMKSAPGSTFTFVLNDRLDAGEYTFIKFRDPQAIARRDSLERYDTTPQVVKEFKARQKRQEELTRTSYEMKFDLEVTPDMKMILVMDPEGGDQVVAYGSGNIQMGYDSESEDLVMRGEYKVDRGTYNFTLQDIIIRDFTINEGSSVTFVGDPYSAVLNLQATYATNANLTDLDESFMYDKEINRTKVPVHALLNVDGDMRNPGISFDLAFPTLTSDTYRKVKSIISTDDMMNQQIIYLLALNRFYTPEYSAGMSNTARGSELTSIASSTLSSQLSSMLGQLSDNWSISPNLRSARGDFSDVEFDLALSSQLLNNRLLFNGNFGYRDKSLNTNQFIGDFDLEYLLNRTGNLRLKAYNRYNDQNFYVKTAMTTQGVGLVYRRDFDNLFRFLHRHNEHGNDTTVTNASTLIEITDSIAH